MKITKTSGNLAEIVAEDDGNVLHCISTDTYFDGRRATVRLSTVEDYDERPKPPYTKARYKEKLVSLIRERYDTDDEMNVLHDLLDAMVNPTVQTLEEDGSQTPDKALQAYQTYNAYVNECRARAMEELTRSEEETESEKEIEEV